MDRLTPVSSVHDIPDHLRDTPLGLLLEYHNLGRPHESYDSARLLIGMCMDNRKHLHMPDNFAFIIRTGGANLRFSEFKVSYAIAVGKVNHVALIGHSQCGMVNLHARKDLFINGLVQSGWDKSFAEEHFNHYSPLFEIGNEIDFLLTESVRLRNRYPRITVCPMYYKVEDNLLYLVREPA
jgi:carbonic anhydrase